MRRIALPLLVVALLAAASAPAEAKPRRRARVVRRVPARLVNGVRLPAHGDGYEIPETWADRGLSYGTPQLVTLIERVAKRLDDADVGAPLYVADLSPRGGGPSAWHRSHKTGRDVDLLFFATDDDGQPAPAPSQMLHFDADGTADDGHLHFDATRNWELVKALLNDRAGRVTHIFIAEPLEQLILDHAAEAGEPDRLVARAAEVMHQPGDSAPHDDHMHVRIAPSGNNILARTTTKAKPRPRNKPRLRRRNDS